MKNSSSAFQIEYPAQVFAALGDPVRLRLVNKLNDNEPHSITDLTGGTKITRQAITRHLSVLEGVGLVTRLKDGRETLFVLDATPLKSMKEYLEIIASQWDHALDSLKNFVENQ